MAQYDLVETPIDFSIKPFVGEVSLINQKEKEPIVLDNMQPPNSHGHKWITEKDHEVLQYYFRELEIEPLFTPSEEVEVAIRIKKYKKRIKKVKNLLNKAVRQSGNDIRYFSPHSRS